MGKPIVERVAAYLAPVLKDAGFDQDRRTFRHFASNGDAVIVELQVSSGSGKQLALVYVNLVLVPLPWLEWIRESGDEAELQRPRAAEGLVSGRLTPPGGMDWQAEEGEVDAVGSMIAERLPGELDRYLELLERDVFLQRLEEDAKLPGACPREAAKALMLALQGDRWKEIDRARRDPVDAFDVWIDGRFRAQQGSAPSHGEESGLAQTAEPGRLTGDQATST